MTKKKPSSNYKRPIQPYTKHLDRHGYVNIPWSCLSDKEKCYFPRQQKAAKAGKHVRPVLEHRLVMSRFLDRPLRSDEIVRHMNGDKTCNDISNLQIGSSYDNRMDHKTAVMEMIKWRSLAVALFYLYMHDK